LFESIQNKAETNWVIEYWYRHKKLRFFACIPYLEFVLFQRQWKNDIFKHKLPNMRTAIINLLVNLSFN
jgi:hypothetical protein